MKDPKKIWRARASRKAASLQSFKQRELETLARCRNQATSNTENREHKAQKHQATSEPSLYSKPETKTTNALKLEFQRQVTTS
jgi:tryptophan 2,3-dioxygenase